jgi:myo-inositol-1(or 4)-monophosphatase
MDLINLCVEIENAATEAGAFIMKESGKFSISMADAKGFHDFVSYVDKGSEEMLVRRLGKLIPEAGFITEEGTSSKKGAEYIWIIDPLDGTTNFLHGVHPFSISIALKEKNDIIAGLVHEPGYKETFIAWKGGGSWLNGKQVCVSEPGQLNDCILATGFPYKDFSALDQYMKCLEFFIRNTHGVRRMGSAAIDLAYVACGRFDIFFEYGLNPWDVAAGIILIREAGGCVTDFSGNEEGISGAEIVAANGKVFPEVLENLSKFMRTKQL